MPFIKMKFTNQSKLIKPQNPMVRDDNAVNYDMDSEDEWNEMFFDDLEKDEIDDDDEEDESNSEFYESVNGGSRKRPANKRSIHDRLAARA